MKSIVPGAALAVVAIPQHLFPLPPPLCCWQCLHADAAYPRTVRDKSRAADSPRISPPVQPLGLSTADEVQNQTHPCKGVQCKEWACASLTPKQPGTPHLHPKRAGEPGMQDEARLRPAVLVQPPGDSSGGSSEAGSRGTGAALCRRSPA